MELEDLLDLHIPGCASGHERASGSPAFPGKESGAVIREAEVPGQGAELRGFGPPLNENPPDGVAFLDVVNILQEIQVQVEAIWSLDRVGELLPLVSALRWFR